MKNILLSIKPKYVEKILNWTKKYELRKRVPKDDIDTIYIYETVPSKKIVAKFKVEKILDDNKEKIWDAIWEFLWISKEDFMKYFFWKENACAYKIWDIEKLDVDPYKEIENFSPPQGYKFVKFDF